MKRLSAILTLMMLMPAASADEARFVGLKDFRTWPAVAQQAYVLGVIDQALAAAYQYEPEMYPRIISCLGKVKPDEMFGFVIEQVLKQKSDESLIPLIGDGVYEFCEKNGYSYR